MLSLANLMLISILLQIFFAATPAQAISCSGPLAPDQRTIVFVHVIRANAEVPQNFTQMSLMGLASFLENPVPLKILLSKMSQEEVDHAAERMRRAHRAFSYSGFVLPERMIFFADETFSRVARASAKLAGLKSDSDDQLPPKATVLENESAIDEFFKAHSFKDQGERIKKVLNSDEVKKINKKYRLDMVAAISARTKVPISRRRPAYPAERIVTLLQKEFATEPDFAKVLRDLIYAQGAS